MGSYNIQWLEVLMIVGWLVSAAMLSHYFSMRAKRRALELNTTRDALAAHYEAMNRIVDDPALPLSALKFLSRVGRIISDKDDCNYFINAMMADEPKQMEGPSCFDEIDKLSKTNPDLVGNFNKAVSNGIIVIFLRWPGNGWKLQRIFQQMAADSRSETAFAERVAAQNCRNGNGNDGGILPGGLVAA